MNEAWVRGTGRTPDPPHGPAIRVDDLSVAGLCQVVRVPESYEAYLVVFVPHGATETLYDVYIGPLSPAQRVTLFRRDSALDLGMSPYSMRSVGWLTAHSLVHEYQTASHGFSPYTDRSNDDPDAVDPDAQVRRR